MNAYLDRVEAAKRHITACHEHEDEIRQALGVAAVDQGRAASRDAETWLRRMAVVLPLMEPVRFGDIHTSHSDDPWTPEAVEAMARVYAAVWEFRSCAHLRRTPHQPVIARLPLKRIDCQRCVETMRRPPAGEGDRCDWCGARGVITFTPIGFQFGPILAIGDACDDCAPAFTGLKAT